MIKNSKIHFYYCVLTNKIIISALEITFTYFKCTNQFISLKYYHVVS